MDRYEYNVRLEQIRSLSENQEFHEAMVIADTIDWRKVRSVRTLSFISEIYKINRRYEEAKDLLLIADSRCPNARSIIYALCELSIRMGDLNDSVGYLKEYMEMAPQDPSTYVLQYKFYALTNVGIHQRIELLEQLKNIDYQERWGYELAKLYSEAGETQKCIDECDGLMLWFGHGRYVTEAMKLKMLYTDLTPEQQHKFDHRDGIEVLAGAEDLSEPSDPESNEPLSIEITNIQPSNQPTKRIPGKDINERLGVEDIKEPSVNLDKYSTMNLQAELKRNMVDLEEKTGEPLREKEVPLPPMENVTPMKADTDVSEIVPEGIRPEVNAAPPESAASRINADDEDVFAHRIPLNLRQNMAGNDEEKQFSQLLSQDYDGQISLNVPEDPGDKEKQITGQINIEDILNGWNRQKEEHDRIRLEEAKRKSLEHTNDIVNELAAEQPELFAAESAVQPKGPAIPVPESTTQPEGPAIPVTESAVLPEVNVRPAAVPVPVPSIPEVPAGNENRSDTGISTAEDTAMKIETGEEPEDDIPSPRGMKREHLEITSDLTGLLREHRERVNDRNK